MLLVLNRGRLPKLETLHASCSNAYSYFFITKNPLVYAQKEERATTLSPLKVVRYYNGFKFKHQDFHLNPYT